MAILYLGPEVPEALKRESVIHCPLIQITPVDPASPPIEALRKQWSAVTHVLFTSKSAVDIASTLFDLSDPSKSLCAVGPATALRLSEMGYYPSYIAELSTAEGMVELLASLDLSEAFIAWPRAALARPVIEDYLRQNRISYAAPVIYDTELYTPPVLPDLSTIDTLYFSSPSTIDGFVAAYGGIPHNKRIICIGPVTEAHLNRLQYLFASETMGRHTDRDSKFGF